MTKDEAVARKRVKGKHSACLVQLLRWCGYRRIAEVGVYAGATAELILSQLADQLELYLMVDSWTPFGTTEEPGCEDRAGCPVGVNWEGLYSRVLVLTDRYRCTTVLREPSVVAAGLVSDETFDLVFIDADHSYRAVRDDIAAWLPKVTHGGILAGHDYNYEWPGVIRAVDEAFPFETLHFLPDTIWCTVRL